MNVLDRDVQGAAAAHQALLRDLAGLDDGDVRRPSVLPGWTVGHVLTHIARNADGMQRMIDGAREGRVGVMYPGGVDRRNGDIDDGASRPADAVVDDVRRTIWSLEQAWAQLDEQAWAGRGSTIAGEVVVSAIPLMRWREVVVHHTDLGLGRTWAEWPDAFVAVELARLTAVFAQRQPFGAPELPPAALAVSEHHRLAWMFGRAEIAGLGPAGVYP